MKLTHAISNLFRKMFAWWPWRQSTQIEYAPHSTSLSIGATQESMSKSVHEGVTPQTGIAPRLSTVQGFPERVVQTDVPAKDEFPEIPLSDSLANGESMKKPAKPEDDIPAYMQASPSTQQRLEFLQYLVKRGIVNEGFDDEK
jgi:hypothetical protein